MRLATVHAERFGWIMISVDNAELQTYHTDGVVVGLDVYTSKLTDGTQEPDV